MKIRLPPSFVLDVHPKGNVELDLEFPDRLLIRIRASPGLDRNDLGSSLEVVFDGGRALFVRPKVVGHSLARDDGAQIGVDFDG